MSGRHLRRRRLARSSGLALCGLFGALLPLLLAPQATAPTLHAKRPRQTALDRYVKAPDPTYRYRLVSSTPASGHTVDLIEMVSQTWLTPKEIDRPEWTHWLTVIRPQTVSQPTALVFVTGGNNGGKPPERTNPLLADIALTTQSVVAELRMVPNQPVTFVGETRPRREDELIAYAWDKFLRSGDERWAARLPMTKAVVRAMDTVTSFMADTDRGAHKVDRFVVAGASKRGWTTWATAAVDARVVAIVPMVIDMLNLEPSFVHHWRAYGFWAPAIKDYEDLSIMSWQGTRQYRALREIEDPYEYRDRLTLPKLLINSAGDQFFLPDSWKFYFDDLEGEKYLRYVPNTDHGLRESDAGESLGAFYASIVTRTPRPAFTWQVKKDGTIVVKTKTGGSGANASATGNATAGNAMGTNAPSVAAAKPTSVTLWRALAPNARDFRLETIGKAYQPTPLTPVSKGQGTEEYIARPVKPEKGWAASFIELRYSNGTKYPLVFTTGVSVVPDTLPYGPPKPPPPPAETPKPTGTR